MLSFSGVIAVGLYLASLLAIGGFARRAQKERSLSDYYLAGSSLGTVALFFTLYATQYSGNTLLGVPAEAYREGFPALALVLAVMSIVAVYALFAPALNGLARRHGFITPGDFLRWRFRDPALLLVVNLVLIVTLTSYVLANLKAMGLLVEGATGGTVSFAAGVVVLSLVMAIYESLGGMRSVVWTDVLQGSILLAGCIVVVVVVALSPRTRFRRHCGSRRQCSHHFQHERRCVRVCEYRRHRRRRSGRLPAGDPANLRRPRRGYVTNLLPPADRAAADRDVAAVADCDECRGVVSAASAV